VLGELASRGVRGVAFDLPGLGLADRPVQVVVWGASDPALKLTAEGEAARRAAGANKIHTVPARHFLQEDQAPAVAEHIARLAAA
jgi:hypothetical protein